MNLLEIYFYDKTFNKQHLFFSKDIKGKIKL